MMGNLHVSQKIPLVKSTRDCWLGGVQALELEAGDERLVAQKTALKVAILDEKMGNQLGQANHADFLPRKDQLVLY